jgi:hypothetical protein
LKSLKALILQQSGPYACYFRMLLSERKMARMKYVQRRANRFEFRFQLPDDIAGQPFPTPWPEAIEWCVNRKSGRFKTNWYGRCKRTTSELPNEQRYR